MSTYILMKILESAPSRYDRGIRWLTLGGLDSRYDDLVAAVQEGDRVLDIGCGTGALTLRAALRGARVKGIDINPDMMAIALRRAETAGVSDRILLEEKGVAELETEPDEAYDVVVSGLCFSELTEGEIDFTLRQVRRLLKPGGLFLVGDEVIPANGFYRLIQTLIRLPLVAITWLVTQTTTSAVKNLPERTRTAGLEILSATTVSLGTFLLLKAQKPTESEAHA